MKGRARQVSVSSRTVWSTEQVGQAPKLYRETLSQKNRKERNKGRKEEEREREKKKRKDERKLENWLEQEARLI